MKEPLDEGQEQVAAVLMDLQLFADDDQVVPETDPVTEPIGDETDGVIDTETDVDDTDSETVEQDVADETETGKQTADQAFAKMRKEKEFAERQAQQVKADIQVKRDAKFADRFGKSYGIYTEAQYWQALDRQNEQAEEQRKQQMQALPKQVYEQAITDGYDPKIANLMAKDAEKDLKLQQMEEREFERNKLAETQQKEAQQERQAQQIMKDHASLTKKYGALIPSLDRLDDETISMMRSGSTLKAAWLSVHEDEVAEFHEKAGAAKTARNVNSKSHLTSEKSGAGDFGTQVNLTTDELDIWKQMFPKMTNSEIKKRVAKYGKQG